MDTLRLTKGNVTSSATPIELIVSATLTSMQHDGLEWKNVDGSEAKAELDQEDDEEDTYDDEEEKENARKLKAALISDCSCVCALLHALF